MSWQDGLALLIVVAAVLAVLRTWLPSSVLRFWQKGSALQGVQPAGGCGGCSSGPSCTKVQQLQLQVRAYPVPFGRRK